MPSELLLHPKFKDLPTRSIRVSAFTFGLERHFVPETRFRQRVPYPKMREKVDSALFASTHVDNDLSARQWSKWVKGDLKNEPNYLRKMADALGLGGSISAILDFDAATCSIELFLRMLDVFAYRSGETTFGSKDARIKLRTARDGLERLQRAWAVGNEPGTFQLPDSWLSHGDSALSSCESSLNSNFSPPNELQTGIRVFPLHRRQSSGLNFYLQRELLWRYEPEAPLTMLQFLLRFLLHINSKAFVPIQTFAIDLATASLAMSTLFYWDDDQIFFRFGAKMEALDVGTSIFFSEAPTFSKAIHLIKKDSPWIYDGPNNVDHIPELLECLRGQFDTALDSYGISPRKIRQLYRNACLRAVKKNLSKVRMPPVRSTSRSALGLKPSTTPSSR